MFSRHAPAAEALRAVHEGRATVTGTAADPEWLIDDEAVHGLFEGLHAGGHVTFDAPLPSRVRLTPLGESTVIVVLGIFPERGKVVPVAPVDHSAGKDVAVEAAPHRPPSVAAPPAVTKHSPKPGAGVTIDYFGLGPQCLDFANGKEFRDAISRHGYELLVDANGDQEVSVAVDQPVSGHGYLSVVDPVSAGRFYVLYDDETWSELESPGFTEILSLMDAYSKETFQSRLFMAEPETDDEEDELDLWVGEDHPFYGLEFDFATGKYVRA